MGGVIPFYVREFNAASMAEAIHAADQALREDGVTVAVWRDRVSSLEESVRNVRRNVDQIIAHMNRDIFFANGIFERGEARLILNAHENKIRIANSIYKDFSEFWQNLFFGTPYSKTNLQDIGYMDVSDVKTLAETFSTTLGSLAFQIMDSNQDIHQDDFEKISFDLSSAKLFFGGAARAIENIQGGQTAYYSNQNGDDLYLLPSDSMGFFMPQQAGEKAAWHSSGQVTDKARVRFMIDLVI